ncbi:MAG: hypothetical protein WAW61_22520 [Methylococcaceae bacterium]
MSFTLDINKFIEKAGAQADLVPRRIVSGILRKVVLKSPVGNTANWKDQSHLPKGYVGGRFRANWQVGVDTMPSGKVSGTDKSGSKTIAAGIAAIPEQAAGHVYYVQNNLPYAQALEDGHSTQSPPGNMVAGTVAEFESIIREATR